MLKREQNEKGFLEHKNFSHCIRQYILTRIEKRGRHQPHVFLARNRREMIIILEMYSIRQAIISGQAPVAQPDRAADF
jgi:hypothetical protein